MSPRDSNSDIGQWKSALLKLPDDVFFDIMRNYLGELRTPFNKHTLIEELSTFLRKGETQRRILDLIDETDIEVLSVIHLLDRPAPSDLFTFFEGSMSYLELHYLLLNLQERLLVFVDNTLRPQRLQLNPLLSRLLRSSVVDAGRLFPSLPCDPEPPAVPWPSEALMLALYSYLSGAPDLLKTDGGLKKRALEEIETVFPELCRGRAEQSRLRLSLSALLMLGLLTDTRGVVRPEDSRWRAFAEPDSRSRLLLFWAALLHAMGGEDSGGTGPAPPSLRAIEDDAKVLSGFLANLPSRRAYTVAALGRLLSVFGSLQSRSRSKSAPALPERAEGPIRFVESLAELGLLVRVETDAAENEARYAVSPHLAAMGASEPRPVIIEANFQLTLKPSVPFADGLLVSCMAEVRRYDVYPRYEITKRSFVRALEQGYGSDGLVERLERLGESKLPQNVRFSFASWEREYRGIALYRGVVLTADAERRHLIEHSEAMKPWLLRTLAPGVYLLDDRNVVEWTRALRRAGVDPIPPIRATSALHHAGSPAPVFHSVGRPPVFARDERHVKGTNSEAGSPDHGDVLPKSLRSALQRLDLPAEARSELGARINKKLILFPAQLQQAQPKQDKNEAKGLDYVGKVRLVEQALRSGTDLLEILERTSNGVTRRLLVHPGEVRKSGNDLMLYGRSLPENESVQIRVSKIGLVRKLKSSLYAP